MNLKEIISVKKERQVYYYNANQDFAVDHFAGQLWRMIRDEKEITGKQGVIILCIGSDRSTGDSLGPLIGYKLKQLDIPKLTVLGNLETPVHAINLEDYLSLIDRIYKNHVVVAVDASVGSVDHVGFITLGKGSLKPGLGVSKELSSVGDIFITGIVGGCGNFDPLMLQSTRLSVVMRLADCISDSIYFVGKLWENTTMNC